MLFLWKSIRSMKKLLYAVAVLLGIGLLVVSCKKDTKEKAEEISVEDYWKAVLGEWQLTKEETYMNGTLLDTHVPEEKISVVINDSDQIIITDRNGGKVDIQTYSYRIYEKSIIVNGDEVGISKLSETVLVLVQKDGQEEIRYYLRRTK